jgi:hypothetical protein
MKKRLRHYVETLEAEYRHCKTNEECKYLERVIAKLKDIIKRG